MGEVYRARDTRLGREVAIKVSEERFSERFDKEARAIASLNHPNICTLYDVGPNYLVMELVDGAPLKGPLPLAEALRLAAQIADALAAAHSRGIVHRDLKPGNILVAASSVKLLDFGLAKLNRDGPGANDDTVTQTQAGTVLGTAAYMSPEQTEGKPVDARSDIFAFGLVLYELLSGQRAFRGETSISTMAAILHKEPEPLDAPADIIRIITRCLRKAPADRFQTIAEVRAALQQAAAKPAEKTPSIAVLPFTNMSMDKEQEFFSDGLAEEIINALTKLPGLRVIARTSAFRFRGEQDLRKVGETLQVSTVLEGSVRKSGNRLRITAQLINVADDSHIWSDRYDREMADVFAIQDEISQAIVDTLKIKLARQPDHPLVERKTTNLEAYNAYLEGRYHVLQVTSAGMARGRQCYERAIRLDPHYAPTHAGLAEYYYLLALFSHSPGRDVIPAAIASAERARQLDPSSADAYSALGCFRANEFKWEAAGADFARAIELNPADALSRFRHALFYLRRFGQPDEALAEMKRALDLDPLNLHFRAWEVVLLHAYGRVPEAVERARAGIEAFPNFWYGCFLWAWVLTERGCPEEAEAALQHLPANDPASVYLLAGVALAAARQNRPAQAKGILAQLDELSGKQYVSPFALALACAACGEVDRSYVWLDRGLDECDPFTLFNFDLLPLPGLQSDPRFQALLRKMRLA